MPGKPDTTAPKGSKAASEPKETGRATPVGRLLREPLLHFLVLGAFIFALWAAVKPEDPSDPEGVTTETATPGGRTVSRTVTVTPADIQTMRASFRAAWKRDPDQDELADLVQSFVSEEILFREGSALGLDRDDVVVRRRIIEKMTVLARPTGNRGEPTPEELRGWYQTYKHRFRRPAELSFTQIFFDARKRSDPIGAARKALATLGNRPLEGEGGTADAKDKPLTAAELGALGDSFVLPTTLKEKTEPQVAHLFGEEFARVLLAAPIGTWRGPQASNFGLHVFRVTQRQPERLPPFEEIEKHVRADWLTVENRGVRSAAETLSARYEVRLDPTLPADLAAAPALAPLIKKAAGK